MVKASFCSRFINYNMSHFNDYQYPDHQLGLYNRPKSGMSRSARSNLHIASSSRISHGATMQNIGLIDEKKFLDDKIVFLLAEEDNNIVYFKRKIAKEKEKVQKDFSNFKNKINNVIEDLKLSFLAELDQAYTFFIEQYQQLKDKMRLIKQIGRTPGLSNHNLSASQQDPSMSLNYKIINDIERDIQLMHRQKELAEICEGQVEMLAPAQKLAEQIVLMGDLKTQFYQDTTASQLLNQELEGFGNSLKRVYPTISNLYVIPPSQQISEVLPSENILEGLNETEFKAREEGHRASSQEPRLQLGNSRRQQRELNSKVLTEYLYESKQSKTQRPVSASEKIKQKSRLLQTARKLTPRSDRSPGLKSQKRMVVEWAEDLELKEQANMDCFQHQDLILCGMFVGSDVFATGGNDKMVRVYDFETGKHLYSLQGHKSNIITMATVAKAQFLITGGDLGCNSIFIWDVGTWTLRNRAQLHAAAVSGIADVGDGQRLITCSYDKSVLVYNYLKSAVEARLLEDQLGISGMLHSPTTSKLLTAPLGSSVKIWTLAGPKAIQQKQIVLDSLACCMSDCQLSPDRVVVGSKSGRIYLLSLSRASVLQSVVVGTMGVMQLFLIERKSNPDQPLVLAACSKTKDLALVNTGSCQSSRVSIRGRLNIEFGCGIGPSMAWNGENSLAIVSQSRRNKLVKFFDINIL